MKNLLRALGVTFALLAPIAALADNSTSVVDCCLDGHCCPDCPFCPSGLHR